MDTLSVIIGFFGYITLSVLVGVAYAFFRVNFSKTGRARYLAYQQGKISRDQL